MPDSTTPMTSTVATSQPKPADAPKSPASRTSRRWLWIMLGLLLAGGIGAALYFLQLATVWSALVVVASVGAVLGGLVGYWNTYRAVKTAAAPAQPALTADSIAQAVAKVVAPSLTPDPPPLVVEAAAADKGDDKPRTVPHNIPASLSPIIGRQTELKALRTLLQEQRLVTLKAMGGIGKTRLALELAREAVAQVESTPRDGIWFIDLCALVDNALVPNAVLAELSLKAEADRAPLLTLTDALKSQTLFMVLDNCEQVIEGVAELASSLLTHCAGVTLLCTSREALNVAGETVYPLPTLPHDEAVALFTARARAVRTGFMVDASNQALLDQLITRLDGISLAIELAAARMRSLALADIVRLLDDRFAVLTGGSRTALPRQQTLHALIDWSYQLLSEPEKVLFARLAVFNGDFPLGHAQAICCAMAPLQEREALDLMGHLVDKSLLLMDELVQHYQLLETVRAYALEALQASGEEATLRQAHARFYAGEAEAARLVYDTDDWDAYKARIAPNHSNYRSALEWALQAQHDIASGITLATGLWPFWNESGMSPLALHWQELALRHGTHLPPLLQGRLRFALGSTCMNMGRLAQATTLLRESVALLESVPEGLADLGAACNDLGVCLGDTGQLAEEEASLYERAASLALQVGNAKRYQEAMANLATALGAQGRYEEADQALAQLLAQQGAKLARENRVYALTRRALFSIPRGVVQQARPWLDEALPLIVALGDNPNALLGLHAALRVETELGQWAAAARLGQMALATLARQPQNRIFPNVADRLALLAARLGHHALAARATGLANRLRTEMGSPRSLLLQADHEAVLASLGDGSAGALGEAALAQHLAEGAAMTVEAFIAEAQGFCAGVVDGSVQANEAAAPV